MAEIEPILGRYLKLEIAGEPYRIYFEEAGEGIPRLWRHAAGAHASYDGRETAPRGARPALFLEAGKPMSYKAAAAGGTAVGVPGVV
ncbi:MAG: hypothetical protein VW462_11205, partial [Rhodospirillales bacterium]